MIVNKKINTFTIKSEDIIRIANEIYSHDDISDEEIQKAIQQVLAEQPKAVVDYKSGKLQVMSFLIGMVIKKLNKKVDSKRIQTFIQKTL